MEFLFQFTCVLFCILIFVGIFAIGLFVRKKEIDNLRAHLQENIQKGTYEHWPEADTKRLRLVTILAYVSTVAFVVWSAIGVIFYPLIISTPSIVFLVVDFILIFVFSYLQRRIILK